MDKILDTHNFIVRPSDCDFLGHMNIARYLDACSDSGFTIQAAWGLTTDDVLKGRQMAFVVLNANSTFHRELKTRDHVYVRSELMKIGTKSTPVTHRFYCNEILCFESVFTLVLMDLKTRKATVISDELRGTITAAHT